MEIKVKIYPTSKLINFSFRFPLNGVFREYQGGKGGKFRVMFDNVICTFLKFNNFKNHQNYITFTFIKM